MARNRSLLYRVCKRSFDIAFSTVAVAVCAIPVAFVCVAIRLESPGAPVYSQARMGKGGRVIRVLKLRSMVADADDVAKYLESEQLAQWETERKVDGDPRITRVGRLVRSVSLDELPQFLNVLAGQMSVVGPRPITRDELERHFTPEEREELLLVRPGTTGPWQAGPRNDATFESGERQRIELGYVQSMGFAADTKCVLGTVGAMFGRDRTGR